VLSEREAFLYVVFSEELEGLALVEANAVRTLQQAFARISIKAVIGSMFSYQAIALGALGP
jgi:hypothetical protein